MANQRTWLVRGFFFREKCSIGGKKKRLQSVPRVFALVVGREANLLPCYTPVIFFFNRYSDRKVCKPRASAPVNLRHSQTLSFSYYCTTNVELRVLWQERGRDALFKSQQIRYIASYLGSIRHVLLRPWYGQYSTSSHDLLFSKRKSSQDVPTKFSRTGPGDYYSPLN